MKVTKKREPRKTVRVAINGVLATTSDLKVLWAKWKAHKVRFRFEIDADGDIIITTLDDEDN